jgi:S1-C subfamily serine protease
MLSCFIPEGSDGSGPGLRIGILDDTVRVIGLTGGSRAEMAGLNIGDILVSVNGTSISPGVRSRTIHVAALPGENARRCSERERTATR